MNRRTPYKVPFLRKDCAFSSPPSPRLSSAVLDPSVVVVRLPGQSPQTPLSDPSAASSPNQHSMLSLRNNDITAFTGIDCELPFDIPISDSYFYGENGIWDVDAGGSVCFASNFQPNFTSALGGGESINVRPTKEQQASPLSQSLSMINNSPMFINNNRMDNQQSKTKFGNIPMITLEQADRNGIKKQRGGAQTEITVSSADDDCDADQAEMRRQIHIQSEQRRRAQIKDGFEDLRQLLPSCHNNRKISKAVILSKAVMYIEQLKASQLALAQELQRLQAENDDYRAWQQKQVAVLQSINAAAAGSNSLW